MITFIRRSALPTLVAALAGLLLMTSPAGAACETFIWTDGTFHIDLDGDTVPDLELPVGEGQNEHPCASGTAAIHIRIDFTTNPPTPTIFTWGDAFFDLWGSTYELDMSLIGGNLALGTGSPQPLSGTLSFQGDIYEIDDCTRGDVVCDDVLIDVEIGSGSTYSTNTFLIQGDVIFDVLGDCQAPFAALPFGSGSAVSWSFHKL